MGLVTKVKRYTGCIPRPRAGISAPVLSLKRVSARPIVDCDEFLWVMVLGLRRELRDEDRMRIARELNEWKQEE